ncbi:MAG: tRNA-dependent cyclodipeptide synthase [Candidatus Paceibacterota bacterium]|jgi:tRNA-dependent cyclodipeptide synthase
MRINTYLNITPEEIRDKRHNIWLGISLGNKYFFKDNIEKYIKWAIANTKDGVLIVIPDALHTVNLEVLDKRSPKRALRKATKIGDKKNEEIQEIIATLSSEDRNKVRVVRWGDVTQNEIYKYNLQAIKDEFVNNKEFHDFMTDIVVSGRSDRVESISKMSQEELDRLTDYVLYELPLFVNGVHIQGSDLVYTLLPYPGLNKLDDLCIGLSNRTMFPHLADKLHLSNHIGIVEAYVD